MICGLICHPGISVEQYWSASWEDDHNNRLSHSYEKNPKLGQPQVRKSFLVMEVKAKQSRLSSSDKNFYELVIEHS